jgi:hypothetical protein
MHFELSDIRIFIHVAESPSLTQGRAQESRHWRASWEPDCSIATAEG